MNLVLASNSPRRKELLEKFDFKFIVHPSNCEEIIDNKLSPFEIVKYIAKQKAQFVFNELKNENLVVLGADTIVLYNNVILGKPKSKIDAIETLKLLSNKTHQVITGYCIINSQQVLNDYCVSEVTFNDLSLNQINEYVETGISMDKAGSYAIQDDYKIVKSYSGSYYNIVGLPIDLINNKIKEFLK